MLGGDPETRHNRDSGLGVVSTGAGPQIPINSLFSFRSPTPGPSPGKMGKYRIRVATGDSLLAGSSNLVQLWLVGEHGEKDLGKILRPIRIRVSGEGGDCGGRGGAHMRGAGASAPRDPWVPSCMLAARVTSIGLLIFPIVMYRCEDWTMKKVEP